MLYYIIFTICQFVVTTSKCYLKNNNITSKYVDSA